MEILVPEAGRRRHTAQLGMVAFDAAGAGDMAVAADLAMSTGETGPDASSFALVLEQLADQTSVVWVSAVGHGRSGRYLMARYCGIPVSNYIQVDWVRDRVKERCGGFWRLSSRSWSMYPSCYPVTCVFI